MPIRFTEPYVGVNDIPFLQDAIRKSGYASDHAYSSLAASKLESLSGAHKVFLTPSGTSALEMMAQIIQFNQGDEVIVPSYTFSSTAMAFANAGASLVFVDVNPMDGCIDVSDVEANISDKTKAILSVAYGGRLAVQRELSQIAEKNNIFYLEDNAQAIGMIGHQFPIKPIADMSTLSFHYTKNITSGGEGGALLVNNKQLVNRAWQVRDKGTNRQSFLKGEISKYIWTALGGSHVMSEISAAVLYSQLCDLDVVLKRRRSLWKLYHEHFSDRISNHSISFLFNDSVEHNAHIFGVVFPNKDIRNSVSELLKDRGIGSASHYEPLHNTRISSELGARVSESGCINTTDLSRRLLRLPLHSELAPGEVDRVVDELFAALANA